MKKYNLLLGFLAGVAVTALVGTWYIEARMNPRIAQAEARIAAAEAACGASPAAPANGQLDTHRRVFPGVNPNPLPATPNHAQADLDAAQKRLAADDAEIAALKAWQAKAMTAFPQWQKALTDCRALADANHKALTGWTVIVAPQVNSGAEFAGAFLGAILGRNSSALATLGQQGKSAGVAPAFAFSGRTPVYSYGRTDSSYYWVDVQARTADGPHAIIAQTGILPGQGQQ